MTNPPGRARATVSIVVATLDGGDMLLDCLEAVGAGRDDVELVVVDNGSSDGSIDAVCRRFPHVKLIGNEVNRGYAPAYNQGVSASSAPFVLLLNNDALLPRIDLERLLSVAAADDAGAIWQPITRGPDGSLEAAGDTFTWWGICRHGDEVPDAKVADVFSTVGAALLIRRSAWDEIDGFNDSYFAYYEETDLCWRARMAGWSVRVVSDATVTHIGSATTGRIFEPHTIRYLAFRNRIRTNIANPQKGRRVVILPLHLLACLAFVAMYALTGRLRSSGAVLAAMWWPVGNRDVMREQRTRVQDARIKSDREVFAHDLVSSFGPMSVWRHIKRSYWFERARDREGSVERSTRQS